MQEAPEPVLPHRWVPQASPAAVVGLPQPARVPRRGPRPHRRTRRGRHAPAREEAPDPDRRERADHRAAREGAKPMTSPTSPPGHRRWGRFRLGVIGPLLSAPPEDGQLGAAIRQLASKTWLHPVTGERVSFGASSIERWYYAARNVD